MSIKLGINRSKSSESIQSTYAETSIGSSSVVSSKNDRLKFLRQSPMKRAITYFINLYSYLFSVLPIQPFLCDLMFWLRLFQMFILSAFLPNEKLYPRGTYSYNVAVFLSILTRLFPINSDFDKQIIFGWIYLAFFIIYICFLGACSYYFARKSTLPSFVPSLLSFIFLIVEHLPHCWSMSLVGALASQEPNQITKEQIAAIVLLSLSFIIFSYLHQMLNIASIFFTPMSFKTVNPWPQSALTYTTAIICFLGEFSGHYRNKTVSIVLMAVCFFLYIFLFLIMEFQGHFLNSFQASFFGAVTIGCCTYTILSIIFFVLNKAMPEYIIIIVIFVVFVSAIAISHHRSHRFIKSIQLLDSLEESKENYEIFQRADQILPHIYVGFQVNHRYCLSYAVFRDSLNIFSNDTSLLFSFAKFLAIYPEEYDQLNWIYSVIKRQPKKNILVKYIKAQLMTILMRRESILSPELKKKLQSITNLIVTAKLRIRNTWEAVLSGTISELEPLFNSYSAIVKQIDLKFTYLQNYHSNNQYALRALSNYERDVQANIELANYHLDKVRRIQLGHSDDIDQVYLYGRLMFPILPPRPIYQNFRNTDARMGSSNPNDQQSSKSTSGDGVISNSIDDVRIIEDEETLYLQDVQTRLRNTILTMHVPSIRASIGLSFLLVFIMFAIPYLLILIMINPIEKMISDPVTYLTNLDKIHKRALHIYGLLLRCIMEQPPFNLANFCGTSGHGYPIDWEDDGGVPANLGGDCHTDKMLLFFAQQVTETMNELTQMKTDGSNNDLLQEVKTTLFQNVTTFQNFKAFAVPGPPVNKSIQLNIMESVTVAIDIATSAQPVQYATSREIVNTLINSFTFEAVIKSLTATLLDYLIDHTNQVKRVFTILEITLSIVFSIVFIVSSIILFRWVQNQKRKIYRCFNALPKTTLSKMIESTTTSKENTKNEQTTKTDKEIELNRQEEKAIQILRNGDLGSQLTRAFGISIIAILILLFNLIFINYGCQYYINNSETFIQSSPILKYISYAYCDCFSALLFLTVKAWKDNGFQHPVVQDEIILSYFMEKINEAQDNYNMMFYGNFNDDTSTIAKFVDNFQQYETIKCSNQSIDPNNLHTVYYCLSSDSLFALYIDQLKRLVYSYPLLNIPFDLSSSDLFDAWHMLLGHVYSSYLNPLTDEIGDSIQHILTNSRSSLIIILTVMLVLGFFIVVYYCYLMHLTEVELKQTLLLLLHAPPNEILESPYIMAIISSDFSSRDDNGSQLDDREFKSITDNYPDGLLTMSSNGTILSMNSKATEFMTTKINEEGEIESLLRDKKHKEENEIKTVPQEIILEQEQLNLNGRTLRARYQKVDSSKFLVILTDVSNAVKLEYELNEETKRKANLVSKLMPSILTPKVMANQGQGVSFSVQSVTITMISLGIESHEDDAIKAFREVHNELLSIISSDNFHTIESVEIVGDCFMVIGGLFDEVNQAERHAREVIKFALQALDKIKEIKQKYFINEPTLCGVATGGPVSGGVIELDIPVFEVCGDVLDLADAMMILGLPDVVHTTRAVYELIYGREFQIKERGELVVPNFGTVVTYIVTANS